ncbi:MAG: hypothetical protein PSV13_17920 [Lacunisphaera sp.]|nr:hypothetical protein [Lacunisphaera sp.]
MRLCRFISLPLFCLLASLHAAEPAVPVLTGWDRVMVAPMKTSIYVGSITLTTEPFVRDGSTLTTTYEAKVWPWFFWGETGRITITLSDANLASMARSERTEFTGEATNHKNKPRPVTGRADPADAVSGKFKIRIMADGHELIFNGTYRFGEAKPVIRADGP